MDEMRNTFNRMNSVTSTYKKLRTEINDISRRYKIEIFNPSIELASIDKPSIVKEEKVFWKDAIEWHQTLIKPKNLNFQIVASVSHQDATNHNFVNLTMKPHGVKPLEASRFIEFFDSIVNGV